MHRGHTVRGAWLHAWRVCWAPRHADTVPQTSQSDSLVQTHCREQSASTFRS
jgi:hypothetical protein